MIAKPQKERRRAQWEALAETWIRLIQSNGMIVKSNLADEFERIAKEGTAR